MNNYEEMKIESDVFTTARENFDLLMQRLFASMEKNNLRRRQHHFESRFADEAGLGAEWRGRFRRSQ